MTFLIQLTQLTQNSYTTDTKDKTQIVSFVIPLCP